MTDEERVKNQRYDEFEEILRAALGNLRSDFDALNKVIDYKELNPRKLAFLINSKTKIFQQILYCVAMLRDPKLKLTADDGRRKDFARIVQSVLAKENPQDSKPVGESSSTK